MQISVLSVRFAKPPGEGIRVGKNISPDLDRLLTAFARIRYRLVRRWRTSIQVRTIGSVLGASVTVVLILALFSLASLRNDS